MAVAVRTGPAQPERQPGSQPATASRAGLADLRARLVVTDAVVVALSLFVAQFLRFGTFSDTQVVGSTLQYTSVSVLLGSAWLIVLAARDTYRTDQLGHGPSEFLNVAIATVQVFSLAALASYAFRYDLARGYVVVALPLGLVLLGGSHWLWRQHLVRQRQRGRLCLNVLAVGDAAHIAELIEATDREPGAGFAITAICTDDPAVARFDGAPSVLGGEADASAVAATDAYDLVAWAGSRSGPGALRRLGWSLEGTKTGLVVLPGLTDIAGPRVSAHPVSGLPLLYVERPSLSGVRLVTKMGLDYLISALLLLVLLPFWLVIAVLIRATDRGPIFYRQERIGQGGRPFTIWKFRTMREGADQQEARLREAEHDGAGVLFKHRQDPRVTRVGRVLSRFSLDETPQLLNVLTGDMSLVGPRPPLPHEVAGYENHVRRRLLVRPGATGLWQINGRSDLSWKESVRLDLYYVENWSVLGDLAILARTVLAVLGGRGAY